MTQCGLQTWTIQSTCSTRSPSGNTNGKNNMQCTYNILNFFNNVFIFICFLHSHVRTPEKRRNLVFTSKQMFQHWTSIIRCVNQVLGIVHLYPECCPFKPASVYIFLIPETGTFFTATLLGWEVYCVCTNWRA